MGSHNVINTNNVLMNEYIVQVDNQFSARVNNVARLPDFEETHIIYHMHLCTVLGACRLLNSCTCKRKPTCKCKLTCLHLHCTLTSLQLICCTHARTLQSVLSTLWQQLQPATKCAACLSLHRSHPNLHVIRF